MRPLAIAIINLPDRTDRRREIEAQLEALDLDIPWFFWKATDTRPDGVRGCFESHKFLLSVNPGPLLVLEDDAVFAPNFKEILLDLEPPPYWELIYLGGEHLGPVEVEQERENYQLLRPTAVLRTHAYIVKDPKSVGERLGEPDHIDRALFKLRLLALAVRPWIVGQSGSPSDVSDTVRAANFWNTDPSTRAFDERRFEYGEPEPEPSDLLIKSRTGEWAPAGTSENPLSMKMRDGSWRTFAGGGGEPLMMMDRSGEWRVVATTGEVVLVQPNPVSGVVSLEGVHIGAGAPVFLYPPSGMGPFRIAYTNAQGYYSFADVAPSPSTYMIYGTRGGGIAAPDAYITMSGTPITVNFNMSLLPRTFTYEYTAYSGGYPASPGWQHAKGWIESPEGATITNTEQPNPTGTFGGIDALSYSLLDRTNEENIRYFREFNETVSWYVIPVKTIRDAATAYIAANSFYYPQGAQMVRSVVTFKLTGASFEKRATRYWTPNGFRSAPVLGGFSGGTGSLVKSAVAPNGTISGYSVGSFSSTLLTYPKIENVPFQYEAGTVVWSGSLSSLPHASTYNYNGASGQQIDGTWVLPYTHEVEEVLTPEQTNATDYLVYHANVSQVPQPKTSGDFPPYGGVHQYQNDLQVIFQFRIEYLY